MWPDFQPDARSLDTGLAPRRNTEGGIQPADKSLINRRLSAPSPALCRDFYQTNRGFDRGEIAASGVCCSIITFFS